VKDARRHVSTVAARRAVELSRRLRRHHTRARQVDRAIDRCLRAERLVRSAQPGLFDRKATASVVDARDAEASSEVDVTEAGRVSLVAMVELRP
jgi:hypothetical protein